MEQSGELRSEPIRTLEDRAVWREYLRTVDPGVQHSDWKLPAYCAGVARLKPDPAHIPGLAEINEWLGTVGWEVQYYSGFVPAHEYAKLQAGRVFPIARDIRKWRDLAHSAAPDFIHDLFGHLPMLFEAGYRDLIRIWAEKRAAATASHEDGAVSAAQDRLIAAKEQVERDARAIEEFTQQLHLAQSRACSVSSYAGRLERFYTWCMEFGLICQPSATPKFIGGAVLSSPGEMARATSGHVRFTPFQLHTLDRPVDYTVYQEEMFVVSDFEEYRELLQRVRSDENILASV